MTETLIPRIQIRPGDNDREYFDPVYIQELATDIQARGLIYKPIVRYLPDGTTTFQIVAGESRFRAMTLLAWENIPCEIRELTNEQAAGIMLAENLKRRQLNPLEEARAFADRMQEFGWSVEEIATRASITVELVKRRLELLKLRPDIQHLVATGNMPLSYAQHIVELDSNRQMIAMQALKDGVRSADDFRKIAMALLEAQRSNTLFDLTELYTVMRLDHVPNVTGGKLARLDDFPTTDAVPMPVIRKRDSAARIMVRYISDLQNEGKDYEAAIIGNLLVTMVKANYTQLPKVADGV